MVRVCGERLICPAHGPQDGQFGPADHLPDLFGAYGGPQPEQAAHAMALPGLAFGGLIDKVLPGLAMRRCAGGQRPMSS
jgi:hypothetical protein